jgi:hypothetical protein
VTFGGRWECGFATTFFWNDVLEWTGTEWRFLEVSAAPTERSDHGLAYDDSRQELVLFGGTSGSAETWVLRPSIETICDGADDNENGSVDEGCVDEDGDGFCAAGMIVLGATGVCPNGGDDCDDTNANIHPAAVDLPGDSVDDNCDGLVACDPALPWPRHGLHVRCLSRECSRLAREEGISWRDCKDLVREAAQGHSRSMPLRPE